MAVFFNGQLLISPTVASVVDDSAMYNRNIDVGNILAIVGKSEGGKPLTALRFGSPAQARDVLRSGEALKAIEKAFDPSAQTAGPQEVIFIRVNPATQSSLNLQDSQPVNVINLLSTDYGLYTTGIKVKVESGSVSGKKLSTQLGNDYYTKDNVGRNAFSIQYSGTEVTATLSLTETQAVVAAGAVETTIELSQYPTISALVDRINSIADFSATVLDGNHEKPSLKGLDGLAAQDVKSALYTVKADLQACIDWFNSVGEGYVTASRVNGAVNAPANIGWSYLTGGSDGTTINQSWQDAFDVLQTIDCQWVVPISSSAAVWAMTDAHVSFMSNVGKMERRAFVGGDTGLSDADALVNAKSINSDRTAYVHLGFYDYNADGVYTLYPPYIAAGLVGGMFSGVNPGTALTNKAIKVKGLERDLRNPTDTDQLLLGRVFTFENTKEGFKVVQSVSTWLINNNYNRVEVSVGAAVDFVSRNIRNALEPLKGMKATPQLLQDAISRTETRLLELARPEPAGPEVIVGDSKNPPFKNITATIEGDVLRVEFECSPVIPINYVLVTIHAVPYSGSAKA